MSLQSRSGSAKQVKEGNMYHVTEPLDAGETPFRPDERTGDKRGEVECLCSRHVGNVPALPFGVCTLASHLVTSQSATHHVSQNTRFSFILVRSGNYQQRKFAVFGPGIWFPRVGSDSGRLFSLSLTGRIPPLARKDTCPRYVGKLNRW